MHCLTLPGIPTFFASNSYLDRLHYVANNFYKHYKTKNYLDKNSIYYCIFK